MPIDPQTITYIALGILTIITLVLIVLVVTLQSKLKKFLTDSNATTLGDSLVSIDGRISDLTTFKKELEVYLESVEKRLKRSIQSVETVRFNPFKGTGSGGNQSFATAFLDENGDGVILSSLYSREHVSIFSKPIKGKKSEFELTPEETEALDGAKKLVSSKEKVGK